MSKHSSTYRVIMECITLVTNRDIRHQIIIMQIIVCNYYMFSPCHRLGHSLRVSMVHTFSIKSKSEVLPKILARGREKGQTTAHS